MSQTKVYLHTDSWWSRPACAWSVIGRHQEGASLPDQARACFHAGAASRSFTSTAVHVVTNNARQMVRVERTPKAKVGLTCPVPL